MPRYITGKKVFNTVKDAKNVAQYVVARLVDLGIAHSFSLPGDFVFSIDHALIENPKLKNIVSANELNGSYSADGYARVRGAAILSTTFGVGELSALNGVMGAKAENNIIFHLVGFPSDAAVAKRKQVHHSLGDGDFHQFFEISATSTCVAAFITPDNARREMNRVIQEAFKHRQPAYICISLENGQRPLTDTTTNDVDFSGMRSNPDQLEQAMAHILHRIKKAHHVVAVPSIKLERFNMTDKAIGLIEALNIPFVVMPHDKSTISEHHSQYAGFYAGALSDPGTANIVEQADLILNLGDALWSDFSTGAYSNHLDMSKVINLGMSFVEDSHTFISNVYLADALDALVTAVKPRKFSVQYTKPLFKLLPINNAVLTLKSFYSQLIHFLQHDDILVAETGSTSINLSKFPLPEGVKYHNQTLWGSIGWGTPAALGIALANPSKRTILVTGEGAHQVTLNELGVMGRYRVNPIIFCINNNGYMVERALELDPNRSYNDLAQLKYAQLPAVFGCEGWLSIKVATEQELASALIAARIHTCGVYIELITGQNDYGSALTFYNQHIKALYQ